jgi:Rab guanine nucleotide exchange factor SEC2
MLSRGPQSKQPEPYRHSHDFPNTIPDPRSPPSTTNSRASPITSNNQQPDLNSEIAALSAKLINAINHQTSLDDALQNTRLELERSRKKIEQLEEAERQHAEMIDIGQLLRRKDVDVIISNLREEVIEEKEKVAALQADAKLHVNMLDSGSLFKKEDFESLTNDLNNLKEELEEERALKLQMEKEKKSIEQELESLTTALFEEANTVRYINHLQRI